jgi:hypothetical protein
MREAARFESWWLIATQTGSCISLVASLTANPSGARGARALAALTLRSVVSHEQRRPV